MPINTGVIEATNTDSQGREVIVRIYYDPAWLNEDPTRDPNGAPLVNGPRGFCLDLANVSGKVADLTLVGKDGAELAIRVGQGNPVTTGPANGRSRTAAQLAALGYTTRGDIPGTALATARAG